MMSMALQIRLHSSGVVTPAGGSASSLARALEGLFLVSVLAILTLPLACSRDDKEDKPSGNEATTRTLPPLEITPDRSLVFTYRIGSEFKTVQSIDDIPAPARAWVRVQDPKQPVTSSNLVYVADLRQPDDEGRYPYTVMTRQQFQTGRPAPGAAPGRPRAAPTRMAPDVGTVVLYSRPGCGACDAARAYLKQRGIPFVEKNIQADPAAAKELTAKAARKGVATNVVPVIDVNGELVVGLDTRKIEALLRRQI
jgi:glutaredoxin